MPDVETKPVAAKKSAGHVVVCCKIPNGLVLRLQKKFAVRIPVGGGAMAVEELWQPVGDGVEVKGPYRKQGETPPNMVSGGYVLTYGVAADHWDQWLIQNADSLIVKNQLISAHANRDDAEAWCRERGGILTGLEPLDMRPKMIGGRMSPADPRLPRKGLLLETADDKK